MGYEIIWESGGGQSGAYKRFFGHLSEQEFLDATLAIESDPRFDSMQFAINDFLGVSSFAVSEKSVRMLSAIDNGAALTNPNIRIAVVTTNPQVEALAHIYATAYRPFPVAVFPDLDAAHDWIAQTPRLDLPRPLHHV